MGEVIKLGAPLSNHRFTTAADAASFTTAGHARLTLESLKTGTHFTYQVNRAKNYDGTPANRWFVAVLNGPDNESDYAYIGLLDTRFNGTEFRMTAKSRFGEDANCVKAWKYFWNHVERGVLPDNLVVRHEGRCGRCGRTLTVPESIDRGIGPECATKM
jgi:hypothetical protein